MKKIKSLVREDPDPVKLADLRVPKRDVFGTSMNILISSLEMQAISQQKMLDEEGYNGRSVMGFKLPTWQRPERWDDLQCSRFIESIYRGVNIGAYMVNSRFEREFNLILLDGQQRMRALERYLSGELAVRGEDGKKYRWTDLLESEKAHLRRIGFPCIETRYNTEKQLVDAYNIHNFGGTPHEEAERAQMEGTKRDH